MKNLYSYSRIAKNLFLFVAIVSIALTSSLSAQEWKKNSTLDLEDASFFEIQQAFNSYYELNPIVDKKAYKHFKRWESSMKMRVDENGKIPVETLLNEHRKLSELRKSEELQYGNWTNLGPFDIPIWLTSSAHQGHTSGKGRIDCIEFHPVDPNIMYAGAPCGGFWKTTDGGLNWYTTTDDLFSIGITDIVVHPTNPDIIYASTGDKDGPSPRVMSIGIIKSYDAGETWEQTGMNYELSDQKTINKLLIDPNNPAIIIAASANGMYKSTDSCANWTQINNSNFKDMEYKPGDFNTIYATSYSGTGGAKIYKSIDAGDSFSLISNTGINSSRTCRIKIAVSPADPNTVFALAAEIFPYDLEGLYKSEDNGQNWTKLIDKSTKNILSRSVDGNAIGDGAQGFYVLSIAISPEDINEIYVGSINTWKSSDGGLTWTLKTHETPRSFSGVQFAWADYHEVRYHPFTNEVFLANDGGVHKSDDGGESWSDLSYGLNIAQFYRLGLSQSDPDRVVGGLQDQFGALYNDGNWDALMTGEAGDHFFDPIDEDIIYSSGHFMVGRSDNGGVTYRDISPVTITDAVFLPVFLINPQNRNSIYYGNGNLYKSTNRGNTWEEMNIPIGLRIDNRMDIAPTDSNTMYITTSNRIYKTTDGGLDWDPIISDLPFYGFLDIEISSSDKNVVWVTIASYENGKKVYRTDDGGDNWINISKNLPNIKALSIVEQIGTDKGVYLGTEMGIFYTDETMDSWVDFSKGLPNVYVSELEIQYDAKKIRAATFGRGMWQSDLYTGTTVSDNITKYEEAVVFPNPAENQISVKGLHEDSAFEIRIFNSLGKLALSQMHYTNSTIDIENFESGLYYYQIKTNAKTYMGKFIVR